MSTSGNTPSHTPDDHEIARLLHAVEAESAIGAQAGNANVHAMRRDRLALRSALKADLSSPLPSSRAEEFSQAVRDEIDRSLLNDLSTGVAVHDHLPVSMVKPVRRASWASGHDAWRPTRIFAIAATLALVGGVSWLAMQRPPAFRSPAVTGNSPRELPSWAILPPRSADTPTESVAPSPDAVETPALARAEPMVTRDPSVALAWAKRGVLAVRIVTDSPRRDRERLDLLAHASGRAAPWALSASVPPGFTTVPTHPWPINTALADSSEGALFTQKRPDTATLAAFGLTLRPTSAAIDAARSEIEASLVGTVSFERVEGLAPFAEGPQSEPAPDSAADVIWWKKPVGQWSPRLRVPVLVEFGTPAPKRAN